MDKSLTSVYRLSFSMLLLLTFASLFWYKLRMLFVDPSLIIYTIINKQDFAISEHRYGSFITQMVPLILSKCNASLQTILLCYSVSFYIFYTLVAFVCGSILGQKKYAILLAMYLTLMVSDVFFWPNNEVHQGIAWMCLFFALYEYVQNRSQHIVVWSTALLLLLAFLSLFSHFLVFLPFAFIWVYLAAEQKIYQTKNKLWLFLSIYLLLVIGLKYYINANSWYDGSKLEPIKNISLSSLLNSLNSGHAHTISILMISKYFLVLFIIVWTTFCLIRKQSYKALVIYFGALFVYKILIFVTYGDAFDRNQLFYFESEWMAFSLIAVCPLVFNFLSSYSPKFILAILSIIFLQRTYDIVQSSFFFQDRYNNLLSITTFLQKEKTNKAFVVMDEKIQKEKFIMPWGVPVESLLLSSINGGPPVSAKLITLGYPVSPSIDSLHGCFKLEPYSTLNNKYFNLAGKEYQVIDYQTIFGSK